MLSRKDKLKLERDKGCTGKRRYISDYYARLAKGYTEITALRNGDNHPYDTYKCKFCGYWHVGHKKMYEEKS